MAQSSNLSLEEKHVIASRRFNFLSVFTDFLLQVQQWLSSTFTSHQGITEHPINAHAIDVLYNAALEAKQDERRYQLVAQEYRQKAEEYKVEGISCYTGLLVARALRPYLKVLRHSVFCATTWPALKIMGVA